MWRLKALYEAYDMRPTRMALSKDMEELELEEGSGRSPFPSTLTDVLLDVLPESYDDLSTMFDPEVAELAESIDCLWTYPQARSEDRHYKQLLTDCRQPVQSLGASFGKIDCLLPRGILPQGLRRLQIPFSFTPPLLVGSIPSTVEVLQLSFDFCYPLSVGTLPSSLVHLVMCRFDLPLSPSVLPPSLQRLRLDAWSHPLAVGVLPAGLQALMMWGFNHPLHPHVLPDGLTHLVLGHFSHPLSVSSLPPTLVSFELGFRFDQPLLPNVLPSSLRVFFHSSASRRPLVPGALPEGLAVLHWNWGVRPNGMDFLPPGSLPSSLRALNLNGSLPIDVIGVPNTVRWLRIPNEIDAVVVHLERLSPNTRVMWAWRGSAPL